MSEEKLWERILQEATQKSRHKEANLILAGAKGSGVKSLLSAMQKGPASLGRVSNFSKLLDSPENIPVTCPIHYSYVNAKNIEDPKSDKISTVNVWAIEQPQLKDLIDFTIKPDQLEKTMFAIVLDWEQPWRFMQDLQMWLDIWHEKVSKALSSLPLDEQDKLVNRLQEHIKTYKEPSEDEKELTDKEALHEIPLPEGVLQVNMGVPIVVVCCKSDLIWNIEKNKEQNEKILDFVMKNLREFCLTYGATLIYTSSKTKSNIDTLYEYIMHRLYGFKFSRPANIGSREDIFIPSGWDSPNLVNELNYLEIADKVYEEVLAKPKSRHVPKEEIPSTPDQEFLYQLKEKLETGAKKKKDLKPIEKPNPGGDVVVSRTQAPEASSGGQNTLHQFYQRLLEKGSKDKKDNS